MMSFSGQSGIERTSAIAKPPLSPPQVTIPMNFLSIWPFEIYCLSDKGSETAIKQQIRLVVLPSVLLRGSPYWQSLGLCTLGRRVGIETS